MSSQHLVNTLDNTETPSVDRFKWDNMILAVYNFLCASTTLSQALKEKYKEECYKKHQDSSNLSKIEDFNLEEYPYFFNMLNECAKGSEPLVNETYTNQEILDTNKENNEIKNEKTELNENVSQESEKLFHQKICSMSTSTLNHTDWVTMHEFESSINLKFEKQQERIYHNMIKNNGTEEETSNTSATKSDPQNLDPLHNTLDGPSISKDTEVETEDNFSTGSEFSLYSSSDQFDDISFPPNLSGSIPNNLTALFNPEMCPESIAQKVHSSLNNFLRSEEIQTTVNRRFGGTLKSQINKNAGLEEIRKQEDERIKTREEKLQQLRRELISFKEKFDTQEKSVSKIKEKCSPSNIPVRRTPFDRIPKAKPKTKLCKLSKNVPPSTKLINFLTPVANSTLAVKEKIKDNRSVSKQSKNIAPDFSKILKTNAINVPKRPVSQSRENHASKSILLKPVPMSPHIKVINESSSAPIKNTVGKESKRSLYSKNRKTNIFVERLASIRKVDDRYSKEKKYSDVSIKKNSNIVRKPNLKL